MKALLNNPQIERAFLLADLLDRAGKATFSLFATLLFAASLLQTALEGIAILVALSAGISWLLFGLLLRPYLRSWGQVVDVCLGTMVPGNCLLLLAALVNLHAGEMILLFQGATNLALLLTSNLTMFLTFKELTRHKLAPRSQTFIWWCGLNVLFVLLATLIYDLL